MHEIHPVAAVALSEAVADKQLREFKLQIAEGTNIGFDFAAKLKGRLTRTAGVEAAATCSLLNEAVLAEVIRRLGVTRQAFEVALFEVAMEAHVAGVSVRDQVIQNKPELLTVIELIKRDVVAKLPRQKKSGAIKVISELEITRLKVA